MESYLAMVAPTWNATSQRTQDSTISVVPRCICPRQSMASLTACLPQTVLTDRADISLWKQECSEQNRSSLYWRTGIRDLGFVRSWLIWPSKKRMSSVESIIIFNHQQCLSLISFSRTSSSCSRDNPFYTSTFLSSQLQCPFFNRTSIWAFFIPFVFVASLTFSLYAAVRLYPTTTFVFFLIQNGRKEEYSPKNGSYNKMDLSPKTRVTICSSTVLRMGSTTRKQSPFCTSTLKLVSWP